jgi:hypothetical protein
MNKNELLQVVYQPKLISGKDKLGFWYRSLALLGESVVFNYGQESDLGMDWSYYKHEDYDGLSALQHYFEEKFNTAIDPPSLNSDFKAPGFLQGLLGAVKYQTRRELPKITWKSRDFTKGITFENPSKKFITIKFEPEESKRLFHSLSKTKTNFNCLCMIEINKFIIEHFLDEHDGKFLWMLPVNMRGQVDESSLCGNRSSYLDLVLEEDETAQSLRQKMIHKLTNKEHWYVWFGAKIIPKFFSKGAFKTIQSHLLDGGPPYVGNFSNLGKFQLDKKITKPIFLGTNVTSVRPIGVGVISVNDYLTITLQFHETLGISDSRFESLNKDFQKIKEIL